MKLLAVLAVLVAQANNMKHANKLDKIIEQLEAIKPTFNKSENEHEFNTNKKDIISLLNDMVELLHDDIDEVEADDDID